MPNRNGKLRSYRGPATAFAYLLAAGVFVTYALLKRSWTIRNGEPSQYTIEILNPAAIQIFAWAGFIAFGTLLVLCLVSLKTKWIRWPAVGIAIALLMYPISIVCHAVNNLGPWTTHGSLVADDGATYVFCDSSFLQGRSWPSPKGPVRASTNQSIGFWLTPTAIHREAGLRLSGLMDRPMNMASFISRMAICLAFATTIVATLLTNLHPVRHTDMVISNQFHHLFAFRLATHPTRLTSNAPVTESTSALNIVRILMTTGRQKLF